jgi:NADH-quinone oxidoreductase subunit N
VADAFTAFLSLGALAALLVVLLLATWGSDDGGIPVGELHFLLLSATTGVLVLAAARDLVTLVVALEVLSLPSFVLVGLRRRDPRAAEGAVKYFLFSVVATAVTVYGMALLYGVTGAVHVDAVAEGLARAHAAGGPRATLAATAVVLVLVGFAFKISAVPFHFWAPDTYQGAPPAVAAFLSTVSKAGGLAGLLVLVLRAFPAYAATWGAVLAALAAASMTLGNVAALRQWHLVRLLAWSTVAQAGYLLVPLAVAASTAGRNPARLHDAAQSTLAYLGVYLAMDVGAFACVVALRRRHPRLRIDDVRGLARRNPWLALAFALFLTALAGVPPGVAGLFAKVVVLRAAVHGGLTWLAVVGAVNTVVGLAYYLRVAAIAFEGVAPEGVPGPARAARVRVAVAVAALVTAALSVDPQPLFSAASHAASALGNTVHA